MADTPPTLPEIIAEMRAEEIRYITRWAYHLTRIQAEHEAEVERVTAERDATRALATSTGRTVQTMKQERHD
jgi:hypothetical protein